MIGTDNAVHVDADMTDPNQPNDQEGTVGESDTLTSVVADADDIATTTAEESIYIRAEIEGPGEEVLARLTGTAEAPYEYEELQPVVEDLTQLLETIERTGGGIRSSVAADTDLQASGEGVRHMLELLREYGLVTLEGNTWRLGPAFD